jgi:hypothetical protein
VVAVAWVVLGFDAVALFLVIRHLGRKLDRILPEPDPSTLRIQRELGSRIDSLGRGLDALRGRVDAHIDRHAAG